MEESGQTATMIRKHASIGDLSTWMFYTIILLVVSLPLSEFGMSLSQFLLLGLWVYEGAQFDQYKFVKNPFIRHFRIVSLNIANKLNQVLSNRILLIFLSIYFIHILGFIYTNDLNYGLKDIRVKLPILTLPIFLSTMKPLNGRQYMVLLIFFISAVITGTFASIYTLLNEPINDPREISIFISHIRFALFISFSIFILIYFLFKKLLIGQTANIIAVLGIIWLTVFLFILKSLTGIFITALLAFAFLTLLIFKKKVLVIPISLLLIVLIFGFWLYAKNVYREITVVNTIDWQNLDKYTDQGNLYSHDTVSYGIENGSYVGMYISMPELREGWKKRSNLDFDSLDHKKQVLRYTLIRFLHSKGYRKDATGVKKLTQEEVTQIENGIANVNYLNSFNIRTRFDQLIQGYKTYKFEKDPNASSFMQRIEYWKTSIWLIKRSPLVGYGTGDVKASFENAYNVTNSTLLPEYRHRSHNQFFAIAIAFGVIGLIIFFIGLIYPAFILGKFRNYLFNVFFFIIIFSFLTEDTLETQAGATFFAFFSALLLFNVKNDLLEYSEKRSNKSN